MANCNDLFKDFDETITLSSSQKEELRNSRDAVKKTITEYFKTNNIFVPDFRQQGSFDMGTIIKPVNIDTTPYDIDYGVYLNELPEGTSEKQQIETAKNWICKAVENQTDFKPSNKKNCIRIFYKNKYNIDLPIYKEVNGISYLGTRDSGWQESNPKDFSDWFFKRLNETDEQMRRIVKYLKASADYKNINFKSIAITIEVAQKYFKADKRDDFSFTKTLEAIIFNIENAKAVFKPVKPYENVLPSNQEYISLLVENLKKVLFIANECISLTDSDRHIASKKWQSIFGDRFKFVEKDKNISSTYISPQSPKPWRING